MHLVERLLIELGEFEGLVRISVSQACDVGVVKHSLEGVETDD